LATVTKGLLQIYQDLLGLTFVEHKEPHVWHPEVQLFSVFNRSTSSLVGYFYLDLHPRPGKFTHAAVFGVSVAVGDTSGVKCVPISAMVANFTRSTAEKPALLKHDEVVTYFHEFGHVMHGLLGQTEFAMFSGTRVERGTSSIIPPSMFISLY
jgi:thimet oligopeptidase